MSFSASLRLPFTVSVFVVLVGCAAPKPVPPKQAAMPIRNVSVQPFEGKGGSDVAAEFARVLPHSGFNVVAGKQRADAILTGTVTDYRPVRKHMVILGTIKTSQPNAQTTTISNPVVSLSGPPAAVTASINSNSPKMVIQTTAVGIFAKLVDVPSGSLLWAQEFSYESLDLPSALQMTVSSILRSLQRAAPRLQHLGPVQG